MAVSTGQVIVGDHVLTPTGREAIIQDRTGDGRFKLRYTDAVDIEDRVTLRPELLTMLWRPRNARDQGARKR